LFSLDVVLASRQICSYRSVSSVAVHVVIKVVMSVFKNFSVFCS